MTVILLWVYLLERGSTFLTTAISRISIGEVEDEKAHRRFHVDLDNSGLPNHYFALIRLDWGTNFPGDKQRGDITKGPTDGIFSLEPTQ